jgi:ankyrin repeat protein
VLLLKAGSDVNAETDEGATPHIYAVNHGHLECVRLLMNFGANINHSIKVGHE